jgi:GNAT superfamily N-acetyltransferase
MDLVFGVFGAGDDVSEINALLRKAYAPLAAAGMRYAASWEDVANTQRKISEGECHLAKKDGKIVACAILRLPREPSTSSSDPAWYKRKGVATFGRFAVDPMLQGSGVGSKMMDLLEARARECGFTELACDTSEKASHLISMYERRGHRFTGFHQWSVTNYRSVLLSKNLVYEIVRAKPEDAPELSSLAMRSKSYWPYAPEYLAKCVEALTISRSDLLDWPIYRAVLKGRTLGFSMIKTVNGENRLDNLWIEPDLIGTGLGTLLFQKAVTEARKLGWTSFRLAADTYARDFYLKFGARQIGEVQSRIKSDFFLPHLEFDFA